MKEIFKNENHNSDLMPLLWKLVEEDLERKADWPYIVLPFLTSELVGGEPGVAAPAATAWNLLYLAAEILDDLQDTGMVQSIDPSLEPATAMNAATALIFLAQLTLMPPHYLGAGATLRQQLVCELNRTGFSACSGQHLDLARSTQLNSTQDDYWQIVGAKSGECFAWACRAGAALGGGTSSQVALCGTYGYNLGSLIQLSDDWAGLQPGRNPEDFVLGKKTLPTLYALTVASPEQREHLVILLDKARCCPEARTEALTEIYQLGGLYYVLVEAEILRKRARTALGSMCASSVRRHLFLLLDNAFPLPQWSWLVDGHNDCTSKT
jgi:competence protein ComQ